MQFGKDTIAGLVAGTIQIVVGQPFDTIKVRLQDQHKGGIKYAGPIDCLVKLLKNEGFFGLFKGMLSPLLTYGTAVSLQFSSFEAARRFFINNMMEKGQIMPYSYIFLCGQFAGIVNILIGVPSEHTRTKMQVQRESGKVGKYSGSVDCFFKIIKSHGIGFNGLFRPYTSMLIRNLFSFGFYFLTFEYLIKVLSPTGMRKDCTSVNLMLAGASSGIMFWLTGFPFDVIKTKIMADSLENPKFKGFIDCFQQTSKLGYKAFWKGFGVTLLRCIPVNAGKFASFEFTMRILGRQHELH